MSTLSSSFPEPEEIPIVLVYHPLYRYRLLRSSFGSVKAQLPSPKWPLGFESVLNWRFYWRTEGEPDDFTDLEFLTHYLISHYSAARHPRPRVHNDVDGIYEGSVWALSGLSDDVTIKRQQLSMYVPMLIYILQSAIEATVPEYRWSNEYTANNWCDNPLPKGKDVRECLSILDQCQNNVEIANMMNSDSKGYFAWNFTNIYHSSKPTVEVCQATGASNKITCLPWVEFVAHLKILIHHSTRLQVRLSPFRLAEYVYKTLILLGAHTSLN